MGRCDDSSVCRSVEKKSVLHSLVILTDWFWKEGNLKSLMKISYIKSYIPNKPLKTVHIKHFFISWAETQLILTSLCASPSCCSVVKSCGPCTGVWWVLGYDLPLLSHSLGVHNDPENWWQNSHKLWRSSRNHQQRLQFPACGDGGSYMLIVH